MITVPKGAFGQNQMQNSPYSLFSNLAMFNYIVFTEY